MKTEQHYYVTGLQAAVTAVENRVSQPMDSIWSPWAYAHRQICQTTLQRLQSDKYRQTDKLTYYWSDWCNKPLHSLTSLCRHYLLSDLGRGGYEVTQCRRWDLSQLSDLDWCLNAYIHKHDVHHPAAVQVCYLWRNHSGHSFRPESPGIILCWTHNYCSSRKLIILWTSPTWALHHNGHNEQNNSGFNRSKVSSFVATSIFLFDVIFYTIFYSI